MRERPPLGPFRVPRIECGICGASNHYDAAIGEYQGRCRECSGFLRRPTEAEHRQFSNFIEWKSRHMGRERPRAAERARGGSA